MLRFTKQTIVCLVLAVIALLCQAGTPSEKFVNAGKRVLVIVDSLDIRDTHSQFFKQLEQRGYSLKFQRAKDSSITLTQYGEYLFDNLILFTPQTENFGGELNTKNIQEFIEAGHNVLIASTTKLPDSLREVATDLGVEFDADDTNVIDHFNFDSTLDRQYGRTHTVVAAKHFVSSPVVLGKALSRTPVLFYGLGMALDQDNKLLIPILTGSETSYSYSTSSAVSDEPHVKGLRTTLVAGVQTKKGARVTFVGSLELLSNKFFDAASYGNRDFAAELSKWSFQERGFLRHRGVFHTNKGGKSTPENYRVGEDLEYSVVIEEWNGEKWAPFVADDIQLEFTMLDPYIRTKLTHAGDGKYVASFRVPDVYGVYKFSVDYRRTGYSILSFFDNVIIRPMRLNEYERYIEAAYPYYASAFSVIVGFAIFSFFFIYMAEGEKRKAE